MQTEEENRQTRSKQSINPLDCLCLFVLLLKQESIEVPQLTQFIKTINGIKDQLFEFVVVVVIIIVRHVILDDNVGRISVGVIGVSVGQSTFHDNRS